MQRSLLGMVVLICLCTMMLALYTGPQKVSATEEEPKRELTLLNWSEYMDPELIAEFENRFNARIKQIYYETEDMRDGMLLEADGRGFDLVVGSGNSLLPHARRGWLAHLDSQAIPNLKHIAAQWQNAHPKLAFKAVPLFWGTLGIGYRSDKIESITSWHHLFRPEEPLRDRIVMIRDTRDLFNAALKASGHSLNTADPAHIEEAAGLLLAQKPFVRKYSYVALNKDSAMVSGEVWMAQMYNGDALMLQDLHPAIRYVVPEEGTNLWVDYLAVLEQSSKKKLATQFINFLHEPRNAANLSQYLMYATTNQSATDLLPADFLENPAVFPPPHVLKQSEMAKVLPPRVKRKINMLSGQVMQ